MARQFLLSDSSVWTDRFGTGSDGALTVSSNTTEAPIDSACSGTSGSTSLTATNASFSGGQLLLIHQTQGTGAGNWELNRVSSYSTGTITTAYPLQHTYGTGAQVRVLKQHSAVTINNGVTYTAKAWDGTTGGILAFVCNGLTTVTGTITATGKGFRGGAGGADDNAFTGEGSESASVKNTFNPPGNGGGSFHVVSAGGGHANTTSGKDDTEGTSDGNASLTDMVFGGGGGASAHNSSSGSGGNGGGIILIISKRLTVTGSVVSAGNNGANATRGGSGGAGGAILFKTQLATLGSSLVTAPGGSQGTGDTTGSTNGSVGRIHLDYANAYTGTTSPALDASRESALADYGGAFIFSMI